MAVSIVIPVYNNIYYTRICIESLRSTLPGRSEIIVISNGSTDGTNEYLSGCSDIKVITNEENRGCAVAWNQGVKASGSSWIVILNNDVILSERWLEGLLDYAEGKNADIVSPAIRAGEYNYQIDQYSQYFLDKMRRVSRVGVAHGICFMVSRRVFEDIGLFDEKFRIGTYEDADFFRRAKHAGFILAITGSSIIHHFGSATQDAIKEKNSAVDYGQENQTYYRKKHGLSFLKRFLEKRRAGLQALWWRTSEKTMHGHTLIEHWKDGRLIYL